MHAIQTDSLMPITARPEPIMDRGQGSYLWDNSGRRYLDFIQGWAVNALGHCPPEMIKALDQQSRQLITPSPALHNAPQHLLAQRLAALSGLSQIHFANSGAEANEAAVKLARKWGQINKSGAANIITTHNAFHGRTLAMMAASGKPGWDELFPPAMQGFSKVPFGDANAVAEAITDDTVAIMVEPIQGEAGVIVPPHDYLGKLRDIATQFGVLLILDEVQTGIGRTGNAFAFLDHGIKPDIITLGKGLGGGVPISAVLADEHACVFEHGDQGGTYNGNPLMSAVALAVVNSVCCDEFLGGVSSAGAQLQQGLQQLSEQYGCTDVRGSGLLWAIDFPAPIANKVQSSAFDSGFLINAPKPGTLRFMPALNVSATEISEALHLLDDAIKQVLS